MNSVVINCSQLVTLRGPKRPRFGVEMRQLEIIEDGAMVVKNGLIEKVGARHEIEPLIDVNKNIMAGLAPRN